MDKEALTPHLIEWKDALSNETWEDLDTVRATKIPIVKTLGFVACESENLTIIGMNWDERNEQMSQYMCIPTDMIVKKTKMIPEAT